MRPNGKRRLPPSLVKLLQRKGYTGHYYIPKPRKGDAAGHPAVGPAIQRKLLLLKRTGAPIDLQRIASDYEVTPTYVRTIWKRVDGAEKEHDPVGGRT